jgi:hypothetical protein
LLHHAPRGWVHCMVQVGFSTSKFWGKLLTKKYALVPFVYFLFVLTLCFPYLVWALGTHAMQCNSCLHMSVTTFDLNGFNVFLHVCVSHRSAVSEATVSHLVSLISPLDSAKCAVPRDIQENGITWQELCKDASWLIWNFIQATFLYGLDLLHTQCANGHPCEPTLVQCQDQAISV